MISGIYFLLLLFVISKGENVINFLPGSSMFTKDRDGIIIVTLPSGVNATICNYGFKGLKSNLACGAMGFPLKGITIVSKKTRLTKNMTMVAIRCSGREDTLKTCTISTDDKIIKMCKAKNRVTHVFCQREKPKLMIQEMTTQTTCNKNNDRVAFIRIPGKMNTGFLKIRESHSHSYRFVCNIYQNFGLAQARLFCNLLCTNPKNPRPIMFLKPEQLSIDGGYFEDLECPDEATTFSQCRNSYESSQCDKVHNVALQCGEEIKKAEPGPSVICSNRSMVIEWTTDQSFYINSSLVSLHANHTKDCLYTKKDVGKKIVIKIPLDYCSPKITDNEKTITFQYTIDRSYVNIGGVQFKTKESRDVFCEIPKLDEIYRTYAHGAITYPPVMGSTFLRVTMTLHKGSDFETLLSTPYDIEFYTSIYAKAAIVNPLKQIKLSLKNCFVTSARSYNEITSRNSAKIIDENCPVETYGVQIVPINKWSIGFQFTAFKLVESTKASVNIFCETMKCMVIGDPGCGVCIAQSSRKKRSADQIDVDVIKAGPISMH